MGILHETKLSKCAQTLKEVYHYINFCLWFAETVTCIELYRPCIETNDYPKAFRKTFRRHHIYPRISTLKPHRLNIIESSKSMLAEIERYMAQWQSALEALFDDKSTRFLSYVRDVTAKWIDKKRSSLQKTLHKMKFPATSLPNLVRYVDNLPSVQLDTLPMQAISQCFKFFHPRRKDQCLQIETQFEHFYNQTRDLVATSDADLERFESNLVNISFQDQRFQMIHSRLLTKGTHRSREGTWTEWEYYHYQSRQRFRKRDHGWESISAKAATDSSEHIQIYKVWIREGQKSIHGNATDQIL